MGLRRVLNTLDVECDIGCRNQELRRRREFQLTRSKMLLNHMPASFSEWLAHLIIGDSKLKCGASASMSEKYSTFLKRMYSDTVTKTTELTDELIASSSSASKLSASCTFETKRMDRQLESDDTYYVLVEIESEDWISCSGDNMIALESLTESVTLYGTIIGDETVTCGFHRSDIVVGIGSVAFVRTDVVFGCNTSARTSMWFTKRRGCRM